MEEESEQQSSVIQFNAMSAAFPSVLMPESDIVIQELKNIKKIIRVPNSLGRERSKKKMNDSFMFDCEEGTV